MEKGNRCQKLCKRHDLLILLISLLVLGIIAGALLVLLIPALLEKEPLPYRLPSNVVPYHYDLEIKPYLTPGNFWFEGEVRIFVQCQKTTDKIVLHSKDLTIDERSVSVVSVDDGKNIEVVFLDHDAVNDLLILHMLDYVRKRRGYRIHMKYKGDLEEGEEGFYITTYEDEKNATHYVASTHFEPVNARTAFPCFDEPQLKSTFNITLVRWKNMTSLANMPKLRTEYRQVGWEADIFQESMRMSTYLVAFIFCDYIGLQKGKITVWAPLHRIKDAEFAVNVSDIALKFFERKLKIPYPGPKLDMVPVTSLEAAAMENWGLIIYHDRVLLTPEDKDKEDEDTLRDIAETLAHEIAHQWFGNLVTLKWWSEAWLNEGLTSYMEDVAKMEIFPEWYEIDPTIKNVYEYINSDCSKNLPVWQPVNNSKHASEIFGWSAYQKGGMIARMAHQILGEEVFWNGIKRYLKSYSYRNVEEADLWRCLTSAQLPDRDRLDMGEIMYSWTHLSGIPVVMVKRDYHKRAATLWQKSCKSEKTAHKNDVWTIPITVETKYSANLYQKILWLKKENYTIEELPEEDEWIVVNSDSTGFYITNYDGKNWDLIANQLISNHEVFDATQRFKFFVELVLLFWQDDADVDVLFQHFVYLREERVPELLEISIRTMYFFMAMFDEKENEGLLREFYVYIWQDTYAKLAWVKRDDKPKDLSTKQWFNGLAITNILCHMDYGRCIEDAVRYYDKLEEEGQTGLSYEATALCTVVRNKTFDEWVDVKNKFFTEESNSLTTVLECSNDASVTRRELQAAFESEQDISIGLIFLAILGHKVSFAETIRFFDETFDALLKKGMKIEPFYVHLFDGIPNSNASRLRKVIELFEKHLPKLSGSNAEIMKLILKAMQEKLPKVEKNSRIIKSWLKRKPWL